MNDLFHDTPDVTIALSEIEGTEAGGVFVQMGVRTELCVSMVLGIW